MTSFTMLECYQKMSNDVCQVGWKLQTFIPQFNIGMMQWCTNHLHFSRPPKERNERKSERGSSERKTMQRKMSRNSMQKLFKTQSKC
ncbi:hypothetical protein EUGRSUZ_D02564 [Eucalyptus grandis]|uniref:Uncharacterized protein n=1 Tax=Eucalyptus grandis TaxID=71139 RepID=A0A059CJJ5_EUCGR|nr:hypothetical protein EUGRSUZ_D02564 [Eucalyptus grandis]